MQANFMNMECLNLKYNITQSVNLGQIKFNNLNLIQNQEAPMNF